jgi:hypothetical protein
MENPAEVLEECLHTFKTQDYIMEPGIFNQLKRYIKVQPSGFHSVFTYKNVFLDILQLEEVLPR